MTSANQFLCDTPLYRMPISAQQAGMPYTIVCTPAAQMEAYIYCTQLLGRAPESFLDMKAKDRSMNVPGGVWSSPGNPMEWVHTNILVYGTQVEYLRFGIALAVQGITHLFYHVPDLNVPTPKFNPAYIKKNLPAITECFALLSDDESRRVFASVLKYRVTGKHGYIRMSTYQEYMHPLVSAAGCDWVIDAGAANGATSFRFSRHGGKKCKVIAVEPDPKNQEKLKLALPKFPNVTLEASAVGVDGAVVSFSGGKGGASAVVFGDAPAAGSMAVNCISLPAIYKKYALSGHGLISFDIEGSEIPVLKQDIAFLQETRPRLQVSLYHRENDLLDILMFLANHLPNYDFYMGHHTAKHTETDLYCVPRAAAKQKAAAA